MSALFILIGKSSFYEFQPFVFVPCFSLVCPLPFHFICNICLMYRSLKFFVFFVFWFLMCVVRSFSLFLCDLDPPSLDEKKLVKYLE